MKSYKEAGDAGPGNEKPGTSAEKDESRANDAPANPYPAEGADPTGGQAGWTEGYPEKTPGATAPSRHKVTAR